MRLVFSILAVILASGCLCCCSSGGSPDDPSLSELGDAIGAGLAIQGAIEDRDPGQCENIESSQWRYKCFEGVGAAADDVKVCDPIFDDYGKAYCLAGIARKRGDQSVCDGMEDEDFIAGCKNAATAVEEY